MNSDRAEVQLTPLLLIFLLLFLFLFLFLFLIGTERKLFSNSRGARLPPGPSKLPVIGNLHQLCGGLPHRVLRDLAGIHGPLMLLRLGQVDLAVVSSRNAVLQVTKIHDLNFAHRPQLLAPSIICYGCSDVAFSSYGDYWRQMRRICATDLFTAKRIKSFSAIRAEEVAKLLRDAGAAAAAGQPMNLNYKLTAISNSIVTRASFGFKFDNQHAFIETMKGAILLASGFCAADLFPSLKFVASISGLASKLKMLHCKVDEILDATIKKHQSSKSEGDEENLLDVLLRLKDDGTLESPITFDNIKAVILDVFTGGTETSSTIVEWTMSELIRNPSAMAKAQGEVREAMMRRQSRDFDEEVIGELHYPKLVIKESLRLHPPLPLLVPRVAKEACQVLDYEVPAGTRVVINAWALGRDPLYWGADAEWFRPERFEDGEVDYKGGHLEFIPFGAGRRICPGMGFGMATVELVLAQLLFHFDWELPGGGEGNTAAEELDMAEAFGATVVRKEELRLVPVLRYPLPPAA